MTAPRIFTPEYYERMRRLEAISWWNAGMRDVAAALSPFHIDVNLLPMTPERIFGLIEQAKLKAKGKS